MTALIVILCIILIAVIVVQIGRLTELAAKIRGEEEMELMANQRQGRYAIVFMVAFLIFTIASAIYYKNYMLGTGPHESASAHGGTLDSLFAVTLFFTGIVFVVTQIALFWFSYKYRQRRGHNAIYISHNNRLEVVWTLIPAVVMTFLVISGLDAWNEVMADVPEDAVAGEDYIEIEASGYQFAWDLRYPGPDGKLGARDFRLINPANNPLGQDWTDLKNHDDFMPSEIVLPVGVPVRVRITSKDVLHNFYLPQFRVKMDAVPGLPTYFVFTPTTTTEEYRQRLREYPEYNVPDPDDPTQAQWQTFDYELACAELCGRSHFSMRRLVKIVTQSEYEAWLREQKSYYFTNVRGKEFDPLLGQLLETEIRQQREEFTAAVEEALTADTDDARVVKLNNVNFETGSATLTANSKYELNNLVDILNKYPIRIEVAGHTDNVGEPAMNQQLSEARAQSVYKFIVDKGIAPDRLVAVGYGEKRPVASNDTEEGRQQNRRTEFKILSQQTVQQQTQEEQ